MLDVMHIPTPLARAAAVTVVSNPRLNCAAILHRMSGRGISGSGFVFLYFLIAALIACLTIASIS